MTEQTRLVEEALAAQVQARAPYSHYPVGAAVLTGSGKIFHGCNVESGAYGTTICAERVAIFAALAAGETELSALAVITRDGGTPCGACRQVIFEQCGEIPIYIASNDGNAVQAFTTGELLPKPFSFHDKR